MFTARFRSHPATGKAGELRALLEEGIRERHAEGRTSALSQVVFGDDSGAFTSLHVHDDLAEFQAYREKRQASAVVQERIRRAATLIAQPGQMHLYEVLVPYPERREPARFGSTITFVPAPGQMQSLRPALADYVTARQKAGVRMMLCVSASGTQRFLVSAVAASMAEYQALTADARTSSEFAALGQALSSGMVAAANSEIFEVLLMNPV